MNKGITTNRKPYPALFAGLFLTAAGFAAWVYQIANGLAVTDLNNLFSWGLYMAGFEFFIGLSSGGMLVYAVYHIWHVKALEPFVKPGVISSLAAVAAAGIAILTDLVRPLHVLQMILSPNVASPLFWDLVVLAVYALLCLLSVVFVWFGRGMARHHKWLAFVALPYIAVLNGVTTLLFAVQNTRLWWHSALLPVDSIAIATAAGLSFVMLHTQLLNGGKSVIVWKSGYALLSRIAGIALAAHVVFTVLELATLAWSGSAESSELLHLLFGQYGALYAAEQLLFGAALAGYLFWNGRGAGASAVLSIAAMAALLIHRVMMTLPAFNMVPLTISVGALEPVQWTYPVASGLYAPGQDIFITSWKYLPTLLEWGVALLPLGVLVVICTASVFASGFGRGAQIGAEAYA